MRHDDEEVNVTIVVRIAPSVGTKKPDLFGLKLRYQPLGEPLKQILVEYFHRLNSNTEPRLKKAAFLKGALRRVLSALIADIRAWSGYEPRWLRSLRCTHGDQARGCINGSRRGMSACLVIEEFVEFVEGSIGDHMIIGDGRIEIGFYIERLGLNERRRGNS